jgi:hypothetical protein
MKKAKAEYNPKTNTVWYEGYNNSSFFGFFTVYSYEEAYSQVDQKCNDAGYRLETFTTI